MNEAGTISLAVSPDGTLASRITAVSTVAVPADSTRVSIKVTLDVNNGAAGNDVVFATADSIDGTYTQLGTTVTNAGVTSVHAGTADLEIGEINRDGTGRSEEHTSELQSLMRNSYAVFCLKKKKITQKKNTERTE